MTREELEILAEERGNPCVTLSLNTHRTYPEHLQDAILLRNLVKEAEERLMEEYNKRDVQSLLARLASLDEEVDIHHNLDSLHIFLSNDTEKMVRSPFPTQANEVHISGSFALKHLIKDFNGTEHYHVLLLAQSGVHLYEAVNDVITGEVRNDAFPFKEKHFHADGSNKSDSKAADDHMREFLNRVDKAVVSVYHTTGKHAVVISTEDTYAKLQQVADVPGVYYGFAPINYNDVAMHTLAQQAWTLLAGIHHNRRAEAIQEMKAAIGQGKVITDLKEIYQAALDGRADLLIANNSFRQAVRMHENGQFDLVEDAKAPGVIDDITGDIAREVLTRKGRAVFTDQDELQTVGEIALKVRY